MGRILGTLQLETSWGEQEVRDSPMEGPLPEPRLPVSYDRFARFRPKSPSAPPRRILAQVDLWIQNLKYLDL